jgi:hypothetical protein
MPTSKKNDLKDRLLASDRSRSVIGRKSGNTISISVWFVLKGEKLHLLRFRDQTRSGTKTCSRTRQFELMRGALKPNLGRSRIGKPAAVKSAVEKFRDKYGAADVKKYYSKFDVAVVATLK